MEKNGIFNSISTSSKNDKLDKCLLNVDFMKDINNNIININIYQNLTGLSVASKRYW